MMKNTLLLLLILVATSLSASAQETSKGKNKIVISNDTVYNNGVAEFLIHTRTSAKNPGMSIYSMYSLDNKAQALLIAKLIKDTIHFSARFPTLNVAYDCMYPK